jgi:hypothetical protein
MENPIQFEKRTLLDAIGKVFEESKDCRLDPSFFDKIDGDLIHLSGYFNMSKSQCFLFALIFVVNYRDESVDNNDLITHLDCNPIYSRKPTIWFPGTKDSG